MQILLTPEKRVAILHAFLYIVYAVDDGTIGNMKGISKTAHCLRDMQHVNGYVSVLVHNHLLLLGWLSGKHKII